MRKVLYIMLMLLLNMSIYAQKKTIILDISHETEAAYKKVNPHVFEQYKDIVENKIGASLLINKDKEVNESLLDNANLLIILSPLNRERNTPKNNLTFTERNAIVNYVKTGGRLLIFMDEEDRVDMELFGGNDIVKPFRMEYGLDLPMKPDIGATSLVIGGIKGEYELSYSGSRSLKGGTPISFMNGEGKNVHGAYVKLNNGGTIVAFGETMTGIFMGDVEMALPNGMTITWKGKDDQIFMRELMEWMLE